MRKISLIAAASMLVIPAFANAKPLNELLAANGVLGAKESSPAKVSYSNGLVMDFGNATLNSNLGLQSVYTYNDFEDSADDNSSFDVRNARLELSGTTMNGEFGWAVSNDFGSTNTDSYDTGSTLQDAYFTWNMCEGSGLMFGQMKTAFGHQWEVSYANQQFIDRSNATDYFSMGRQAGLTYFGNIGDFAKHSLGVYNGNTVNEFGTERLNTGGLDNKLLGVYNISMNVVGDYDMSYEGAPAGGDLAVGLGGAAYYGQGSIALGSGTSAFASDYDGYGANVFLGARAGEWSGALEGFYAGQSWDQSAGDVDGADEFGFYVQSGYFVAQDWEFGGRFGWINYDDDAAAQFGQSYDNQYEVNVVLSYYINGHNLKFMTGPSWVLYQQADDNADDTTDFRYQAGLFGHF